MTLPLIIHVIKKDIQHHHGRLGELMSMVFNRARVNLVNIEETTISTAAQVVAVQTHDRETYNI